MTREAKIRVTMMMMEATMMHQEVPALVPLSSIFSLVGAISLSYHDTTCMHIACTDIITQSHRGISVN